MIEHHSGNATGGNPPANYERYFVPAIGAPLAEDLVRVAALRAGERVLDVACGTGVVARLAARGVGEAGSVTGRDPNPRQLAVAALVGKALTTKEIAQELRIGERRVRVLITSIAYRIV